MLWWRRKRALSQTQLWSLAAGGILTQLNSEGFDELRCRASPEASRLCLSEWWGVCSASELVPMLEWLWSEGHSKPCIQAYQALRARDASVVAGQNGAELTSFLTVHLEELEATRLLGWDLCRLINVARWGYTGGYISADDAWQWLIRSAKRIQASFSSWRRLGRDFILGNEYWRLSVAPAMKVDLRPCFDWLLTSSESPWRRLAWKTELLG